MDLALNNQQKLICHKNKQPNQTKPNQKNTKSSHHLKTLSSVKLKTKYILGVLYGLISLK